MNEEELRKLLDKHKGLNFVKRMLDDKSPRIDNKDGTFSTHKMETSEADGKHYAYPTIIQDKSGKLVDLSKMGKNAAWEYAVKSGEMIPFDTANQAEEFSKHEGQAYQKYYNGKTMKLKDKVKEAVSGQVAASPEAPAAPSQNPGQPVHPRNFIDELLVKHHPGWNLSQLDEMNVSVVPGIDDTPAMAALRRNVKPSREGGKRRDISHGIQKAKLNDQVRTLIGSAPALED